MVGRRAQTEVYPLLRHLFRPLWSTRFYTHLHHSLPLPPMSRGMFIVGYGSLIYKPPPCTQFKVAGHVQGFLRRFWQSSEDHRGTPESPGRVVTLLSLEDLRENEKFHNDLHLYQPKQGPEAGETDGSGIVEKTVKLSLLKNDELKVWGVVYYIAPEDVDYVREYLDVREQGGYTCHEVPFYVARIPPELKQAYPQLFANLPQDSAGNYIINSLIYIGTTDNVSFIGPEAIHDTAKIIKSSVGPSGPNIEYLQNLVHSIRDLDNSGTDAYLEDLLQLVIE